MYNKDNIEKSLGFSDIRQQITDLCFTPVGVELSNKILFKNNISDILHEINLVAEVKYINEYKDGIPALAFDDFRSDLLSLKTEGTYTEISTLQSIVFVIEKLNDLKVLFSQQIEKTPLLHELIFKQDYDYSLALRITEIVDEDGEVKSSASERLFEIRRNILSQRKKIENTIASMMRNFKEKGIIEEDTNLSIRSGRLVIPIAAAKKRIIKGVVIDESATGQTAYIEPIEIFELNNDVQDLEFEEKKEILRILKEIANRIRPQIYTILSNIDFIGQIDFINAKSKIAIAQNAIVPNTSQNGYMCIMQGRHPVLEDSLKKQGKSIVPLDLELIPEKRMIIISGPNAGGKSVVMKTAGLIQYMFQSGLLVPIAEGSILFAFDKIFTDIGDQQSIENDLSTYSSHLLNMKKFIENGNEKTLVLIDEFGSGTEPESGGAIAESVLDVLVNSGVYAIITTHYFNLKNFAATHKGVINAAMLFDNNLLKPLYKIKIGKPGSSFALEIAKSIGLPEIVIKTAAKRIGKERIEMEKMIQDLENEKLKIDERKRQLEIAEDFVKELIEKYNKLNKSIIEKREKILSKADNDAKNIISNANALIEKTIREIKQKQAEKTAVKAIRKELQEKTDELIKIENRIIENHPLKKTEIIETNSIKNINKGDRVKIDTNSEIGVVCEVKNNKAIVQFDLLKLNVDIDRLQLVSKQNTSQKNNKKVVCLVSNKKEVLRSLDFRGMSAAEAIGELDKFLDRAMLDGLRSFSILHGKGYGVLRKEIRIYLNQFKEILEYCDASLEFGGEGITEVRFL